jgi:hypothetical protein
VCALEGFALKGCPPGRTINFLLEESSAEFPSNYPFLVVTSGGPVEGFPSMVSKQDVLSRLSTEGCPIQGFLFRFLPGFPSKKPLPVVTYRVPVHGFPSM